MRLIAAFICLALLAGCSREDNQKKLQDSFDAAEARVKEGAAEARKALAAARDKWDELKPRAEEAITSLEERVERLVEDSEALKRLPPDALERARKYLESMREKLEQAKAAHEQGNDDLAVEKADAVEQDRAAVEELLVERPDPPK